MWLWRSGRWSGGDEAFFELSSRSLRKAHVTFSLRVSCMTATVLGTIVVFLLAGGAAWRWLLPEVVLRKRTFDLLKSAFPDTQIVRRVVCVRQDGLAVEVRITRVGLRLELVGISAEGQVFRAITHRPDPDATRLRRDTRYDDFIVGRLSDAVFSQLDQPTRFAVLRLGHHATFTDGALVVDRAWDASEDIVLVLRAMFVVGHVLSRARSTRDGLVARVKEDDRGVRALALLRLALSPPPGWLALLGEVASARGLSTLEALASPYADEVVAAALAIGERGGVDELADLRDVLWKLEPSPQRTAVEGAIATISARLAPDGAGGLSAADAGGELSVAADGGAVAVVRGERT